MPLLTLLADVVGMLGRAAWSASTSLDLTIDRATSNETRKRRAPVGRLLGRDQERASSRSRSRSSPASRAWPPPAAPRASAGAPPRRWYRLFALILIDAVFTVFFHVFEL